MDPYLEPHWLDVHTSLVAETRRDLNKTLPKGLVARVEERVAVESSEDTFRRVGPDVRVFAPEASGEIASEGGTAIEAPFKLVLELDPIIERYIRILDDAGHLVTVIEFISPTNKRQPGLDDYREKRAALVAGGVHVVEVDLVREGNWRALMRPNSCAKEAVSLYRVTIRMGMPRKDGYLFPIQLREPLPVVPIPLRPSDRPVRLALQPLLAHVFKDGRYDETIDYTSPLDPPLEPEDAAWADQLLRKAAKR